MTDHIFDFSREGVRLSVKYEQLVIEPKESPKRTVPLKEIGVLVFSHPMISCTQAVFSGLAENGAAIVICNSKHLPTGMMLPLVGHSTQCERLIQQSESSLPTRKQIWKSIVQSKILSQSKVLKERHGDDEGLAKIARSVRSGDPDNREAYAARRYWPLLFKGHHFRRNPDFPGINSVLNYGYAVLRAITARAICAAGLHPTLGVHHHNRYNPYCLADDLMEPFRPFVDKVAADIADDKGMEVVIDQDIKREIIESLLDTFDFLGEQRTLFDTMSRCTASLAQVYSGERKGLVLPDF